MRKAILIGFLAGVLLDVLFWFGGPYTWDSWVLKLVSFISTPVAWIVSWIKDWPLEQEAAIYCYAVASVISIPLFSIVLSVVISVMVRRFRKKEIEA